MTWVLELPTVNASLNGLSAVLLGAAFWAIRSKRITLHRNLMVTAFITSTLFLTSYLLYHFNAVSPRFPGGGGVRVAYLAMLLSHVVLAALLVPLAVTTLILGLKRRDERHRRWAKWTFPIWCYVSVTGVLVYVVLYVLYEASPTLR